MPGSFIDPGFNQRTSNHTLSNGPLDVNPQTVPEPSTAFTLAGGLALCAAAPRHRRNRNARSNSSEAPRQ